MEGEPLGDKIVGEGDSVKVPMDPYFNELDYDQYAEGKDVLANAQSTLTDIKVLWKVLLRKFYSKP